MCEFCEVIVSYGELGFCIEYAMVRFVLFAAFLFGSLVCGILGVLLRFGWFR